MILPNVAKYKYLKSVQQNTKNAARRRNIFAFSCIIAMFPDSKLNKLFTMYTKLGSWLGLEQVVFALAPG